MSSFVSDPKIQDNLEYAVIVGKTRFNEFVIFLCSSQCEITMNLETELGAWFLYNKAKQQLLNRIKPPVPTEVFKNKKGEDMIKVTVPVVYLKPYPNLELPYNTSNILLSPVLGLVGAMFTSNLSYVFDKASLYEVKAIWLPNSLLAFRQLKQQGFSWIATCTDIKIISKQSLANHPYVKHKSCLRASVVECLTNPADLLQYNTAIDLSLALQSIVVISDKQLDYSDSVCVYVLPTHIKSRSKECKILNIGIEMDDSRDNFIFDHHIEYEPPAALSIDYSRPQSYIEPITSIQTTKINGNGTHAKGPLDFRQALISAPPPSTIITNGSLSRSRSTSQSSEPDGFHVVTKTKKRVEKRVGQTFDESKYSDIPPDPEPNRLYSGVIVSQDSKQNFYIYCPALPYEIQLAAATELPKDLKITDFVEFKCNFDNTTYYYSRPSAEFIRKIIPLFKCGMLKNSVYVQCKVMVPSTFHPLKSPVVFTDFVPKVADKNGLLTQKDVGKQGNCVITRTKQTGLNDIYWLIHKLSLV